MASRADATPPRFSAASASRVRPDRRAHAALLRSMAAAIDAGAEVPCTGEDRADWTSDHGEVQLDAARRCGGCPALEACRDYALASREPAGVWGGTTERDRWRIDRRLRRGEREMDDAEARRVARLEAVAAVRSLVEGRADELDAVLSSTEDAKELAHALAGLAGSLMTLVPQDHRRRVLDGWTEAAVREAG